MLSGTLMPSSTTEAGISTSLDKVKNKDLGYKSSQTHISIKATSPITSVKATV